MPRISPYRIELTEQQRRVLESRARQYTLPYFQVFRAQMVLLAADGLANDEIAASLGCRREKAGRILDRYAGRFEGELLHPGDFVVCADEKPSIQARARTHQTLPARPGGGQRIEHEYRRMGALCYLAAWDVRHARIFDRCAPKDGIAPFDQLVDQFMSIEPYASARRVFLVADNGSAHRGQRSIDRLQGTWPNLTLIHTPIHASWLNQVEIYFSVVQRKVLQPNDFPDLGALEARLLAFARRYEQIAQPFQ